MKLNNKNNDSLNSTFVCLTTTKDINFFAMTSLVWSNHEIHKKLIQGPLLQNLCTDEPVTHPSIYRSGNCKGNFKCKVKMITMPGWCHQVVVVQLSTNSWRHVHRIYNVVQLGPSPFCQTLRRNKKVKFKT